MKRTPALTDAFSRMADAIADACRDGGRWLCFTVDDGAGPTCIIVISDDADVDAEGAARLCLEAAYPEQKRRRKAMTGTGQVQTVALDADGDPGDILLAYEYAWDDRDGPVLGNAPPLVVHRPPELAQ